MDLYLEDRTRIEPRYDAPLELVDLLFYIACKAPPGSRVFKECFDGVRRLVTKYDLDTDDVVRLGYRCRHDAETLGIRPPPWPVILRDIEKNIVLGYRMTSDPREIQELLWGNERRAGGLILRSHSEVTRIRHVGVPVPVAGVRSPDPTPAAAPAPAPAAPSSNNINITMNMPGYPGHPMLVMAATASTQGSCHGGGMGAAHPYPGAAFSASSYPSSPYAQSEYPPSEAPGSGAATPGLTTDQMYGASPYAGGVSGPGYAYPGGASPVGPPPQSVYGPSPSQSAYFDPTTGSMNGASPYAGGVNGPGYAYPGTSPGDPPLQSMYGSPAPQSAYPAPPQSDHPPRFAYASPPTFTCGSPQPTPFYPPAGRSHGQPGPSRWRASGSPQQRIDWPKFSGGKDYYGILGVARSASPAQIKRAYKNLALACHPDRNPGNGAMGEKFKELGEAHGVLSDGLKRRAYDRGDMTS